MANDMPLSHLPGLGDMSYEMLRKAGIFTAEQLRQAGPVIAFLRVRQAGYRPSKNLLWAIYGALHGKNWNQLTSQERELLLAELTRFDDDP